MDIKVNELSQINAPQQSSEVKDTSDKFRFTLSSVVGDSELKEKLQGLMQSIEDQGKKIAKHMDIRDMKAYRATVKEFLNEVVTHSHEFSRENFLDRRGRHRVYGIIKLVDENLDSLAQELVKDEKDHLEILGRVDEIRGLLLDIST